MLLDAPHSDYAVTKDDLPQADDHHLREEESELANPFVEVPIIIRQALLLAIALYALLITVAPLIQAVDQGPGMIAIGLSNLFYITALALPVLFWRSGYGWMHPLIFTALYAILMAVFRRTPLLLSGMPEHAMLPTMDSESLNYLFAYGNFVDGCAAIALFLGFYHGPRWRGISLRSTEPGPFHFNLVMVGAVVLSAAALYLYIKLFGGLSTHLLNLSRGSGAKLGFDGDSEAFGQYIVFIKMAGVVSLIIIARSIKTLSNPLLWPVFAYGLISGYLVNGKRSGLINCALVFGVAWILRNRRVPYFRVAVLGVACFFMLGLLGLYRWSNWTRTDSASLDFLSETTTSSLAKTTFEELSTRSGNEAPYYAVLARVPGEVPILWGKTYLEWGLNFIPRAVWPDKPRGVDVQAGREFYGVDWGMPLEASGEAYWNFLLPGVLIVFFAFGSFLRWLGAMVQRNPGSTVAIVFYAIGLFYFNPTQNGFRATIYAIIPAALLLAAAGYFRRNTAEQES